MRSGRSPRAQQPDRIRRLGVLISGVTEGEAEGQARVTALRLGLLEHGWVEGRNLEIDYRWGGADLSRMRVYATELTALNPDVISLRRLAPWLKYSGPPHHTGRIRAGF